jgi:hypothetical protein
MINRGLSGAFAAMLAVGRLRLDMPLSLSLGMLVVTMALHVC